MLDNNYKNKAVDTMTTIQNLTSTQDNLRSHLVDEDLAEDEIRDIQGQIDSIEGQIYKLFKALQQQSSMYLAGHGNV